VYLFRGILAKFSGWCFIVCLVPPKWVAIGWVAIGGEVRTRSAVCTLCILCVILGTIPISPAHSNCPCLTVLSHMLCPLMSVRRRLGISSAEGCMQFVEDTCLGTPLSFSSLLIRWCSMLVFVPFVCPSSCIARIKVLTFVSSSSMLVCLLLPFVHRL
jgi:hypothetical protein